MSIFLSNSDCNYLSRVRLVGDVVLKTEELKTYFYVRNGVLKAVDGISFHVERGETVGIVGESGSGKSVCALSTLRLISQPGKIVGGKVIINGRDILKMSMKQMPDIRGKEVSMIFQEPMTSLNPIFTVGRQLSEAILSHQCLTKKEALSESSRMLETVGIVPAKQRIKDYPHQLSGGQRQRVMIAIALSCHPSLLIADEPTTALDVTIQAQILDLIQQLKDQHGTSVIIITHDLGVIAETAQRVVVMYAGKAMEIADNRELFKNPVHPYTQSLLKSIPSFVQRAKYSKLYEIPGNVPNLINLEPGCKFQPRCDRKVRICEQEEPPLRLVGEEHFSRCWLFLTPWVIG